MAKKKELYTLSKDGEVISGVEIKTEVKNKVLLDLGQGEGLLVKNKIDVFQTEQEAINESVDNDLSLVMETLNNLINKIEDERQNRIIGNYQFEEGIMRQVREELESKKWYEFWK